MKYLDKVIKVNADGDNYVEGVKLEIKWVELSMLEKALEMAIELDDNPIFDIHQELLEKLSKIKFYADRSLFITLPKEL
ncbi:hypothetical protein PJW08_00700 (plasmid) [Tenacibaculum finnmarkense]|nr:hypothetical protein PJW08_00700 [Tenacibaculum finnmarkense]